MSFKKNMSLDSKNVKKIDVRDVALKYLAHRDRTCQEVRNHLYGKEYDEHEIEMAVRYLTEMNYLNDSIYIEKYIEYGASKGKGSAKIKCELRQKGIDKELIDDAFLKSEILEAKYERKRAYDQALKIVSNTQFHDLSNCDDDFNIKFERQKELQKIKMKVARKLEYLGYSSGVIFDIIDNIFNN